MCSDCITSSTAATTDTEKKNVNGTHCSKKKKIFENIRKVVKQSNVVKCSVINSTPFLICLHIHKSSTIINVYTVLVW